MNILIVSATQFEVKPLLDLMEIENAVIGVNKGVNEINNNTITVLITGIGMVNTAFMMGKYNKSSYDLVINVGVCGSFDKNLELSTLKQEHEIELSTLKQKYENEPRVPPTKSSLATLQRWKIPNCSNVQPYNYR